jgi:hypothetical protein
MVIWPTGPAVFIELLARDRIIADIIGKNMTTGWDYVYD